MKLLLSLLAVMVLGGCIPPPPTPPPSPEFSQVNVNGHDCIVAKDYQALGVLLRLVKVANPI